MRNNKLQEGDRVIVNWSGDPSVTADIIHVPQGAGDLWGYKTTDNKICFINPYSSEFEAFIYKPDIHD